MKLELLRPLKVNGRDYGRGDVINVNGPLCEELLERRDAVPAEDWIGPAQRGRCWVTGWRER